MKGRAGGGYGGSGTFALLGRLFALARYCSPVELMFFSVSAPATVVSAPMVAFILVAVWRFIP